MKRKLVWLLLLMTVLGVQLIGQGSPPNPPAGLQVMVK